ncbi:NAD-dependent epimerase/dehydratase family protein [Paenibacillus crassostreae]|uniref:NAD-dependent dehydratase n=1 Tax=Paenibacillus crassostreae TaxID=1763538 RepID=A0A167DM77_9BACL|nr:NAD-dependent epimerase/dehydratase family protein [Paenibacillus crassostreae]AOZ91289.1 NAD-dependent dehydratase [Paenibacillus crassostreae]OAB74552.1 NAD-dependent dehydratase [Paenibacillus crassostreae]
MKTALLLGGTRFFGKRLVELLLEEGIQVTIATRGITSDSFGDRVNRLIVDRESYDSLLQAVANSEWDVVYDNICYSPLDAWHACEVFAGKVKRYINTSSMSVYELSPHEHHELEIDPATVPIRMGGRADFDYGTGKKLAEAVFAQKATFPVCSVRFSFVVGTDDYTRRLEFHIDRMRQGTTIGIPSMDAKINFISSDEAATLLCWLKDQSLTGPLNACSTGSISLSEIISLMEQGVGKTAIIEHNTDDINMSPYGVGQSFYMSNSKGVRAGFDFTQLNSWFPDLISYLYSDV